MARKLPIETYTPEPAIESQPENKIIRITFLRSWGIGLLELLGLAALVKLIKDIKEWIGLDKIVEYVIYLVYAFLILVALPVILGYFTLKIHNKIMRRKLR